VLIKAKLVDLLDPKARARIIKVTSSGGDSKRRFELPDVIIVGDLLVLLRAERDKGGVERVYTIDVEGRDGSGNTVVRSVEVVIPGRPRS
jgi:hypothetical protein